MSTFSRCIVSLALAGVVWGAACPAAPVEPQAETANAQAVALNGVDNLYRVSPDLYRSAQPDRKGFTALGQLGIRSVLNLREYHKDNRKAAGLGMQLMHHPVAAGKLAETDIEQCLRLLRNAPKPALVHCLHGSDRTGTIVAAYRIVEQGWAVEDAIAELQEKRFGYHALWYPNIPALLRSIDWDELKKRLEN